MHSVKLEPTALALLGATFTYILQYYVYCYYSIGGADRRVLSGFISVLSFDVMVLIQANKGLSSH